jgi:hypothetical protein
MTENNNEHERRELNYFESHSHLFKWTLESQLEVGIRIIGCLSVSQGLGIFREQMILGSTWDIRYARMISIRPCKE